MVIDGGCPLMFEPAADVGHKVMRFLLSRKVPKAVPEGVAVEVGGG
jgi:hypothetical protein